MPKLRSPNKLEYAEFPVFAVSWYADPANGNSVVAYSGGGGSAKTGVKNELVLDIGGSDELRGISTGKEIGIALNIYKNPVTANVWVLVSREKSIHRYSIPEGTKDKNVIAVGETSDALAVNAMGDRLASGSDAGVIRLYAMDNDCFGAKSQPLATCKGHNANVTCLAFSPRNNRLISASKDGTACVWSVHDDTIRLLAKLNCSLPKETDPKQKAKSKRGGATTIIVRGCAFADLDGKVAFTVASPRRGSAYLSRWIEATPEPGKAPERISFKCQVQTKISNSPVSAMSLSQDGELLAVGNAEGAVFLWGIRDWQLLKEFRDVHDLPVTGVAARPYAVPLQGESNGIQVHVRSVSADSKLGFLTLQTRVPKKKKPKEPGKLKPSGGGFFLYLYRLLQFVLLVCILFPILEETQQKCGSSWDEGLDIFRQCVLENVVIAPAYRPGITEPPY